MVREFQGEKSGLVSLQTSPGDLLFVYNRFHKIYVLREAHLLCLSVREGGGGSLTKMVKISHSGGGITISCSNPVKSFHHGRGRN